MSFIQQAVLVDPNDEFKPYLPTLKIALYDKGQFVRNLQGPKGDKGDKGDQGDPGPAGGGTAGDFQNLVAAGSVTFEGLLPDEIYEVFVDGMVSTSADTTISLKTVGGNDNGTTYIVKDYVDTGGTYAEPNVRTNEGLALAMTGWNSNTEMLIRATVSLREDRRIRVISDYTIHPDEATDRVMRARAGGFLANVQSLDALTLHFGAGTFTGRAGIRQVV